MTDDKAPYTASETSDSMSYEAALKRIKELEAKLAVARSVLENIVNLERVWSTPRAYHDVWASDLKRIAQEALKEIDQ